MPTSARHLACQLRQTGSGPNGSNELGGIDEVRFVRLQGSGPVQGGLAIAIALTFVAGCLGSSPRPETKDAPPPVPAGSRPLGRISWTAVDVPAGLGPDTMVSDAAAGPAGFVLVGQSGELDFQGVVLRSADGRSWQPVHDPDLRPWSLSTVITTDAGFLAIGGNFTNRQADGTVSWSSAILTSDDGAEWTVNGEFDGLDVENVAARGRLVVATTDGATLLVSGDTGATWRQVPAASAGFGTGIPAAVGVLGSRWIAVGTIGTSAAAWSSPDGMSWGPATIEAAGPVAGIRSVTPYAIAAGTSVAVAAGTDDPTDCADGDDFCAHWGAGWSTQDGQHWQRLPRETPLTEGTGAFIWPAGDAGVVALGFGLSESSNGWAWSSVSGTEVIPLALAIRDQTVVAAGLGTDAAGDGTDAPSTNPVIWLGAVSRP